MRSSGGILLKRETGLYTMIFVWPCSHQGSRKKKGQEIGCLPQQVIFQKCRRFTQNALKRPAIRATLQNFFYWKIHSSKHKNAGSFLLKNMTSGIGRKHAPGGGGTSFLTTFWPHPKMHSNKKTTPGLAKFTLFYSSLTHISILTTHLILKHHYTYRFMIIIVINEIYIPIRPLFIYDLLLIPKLIGLLKNFRL